MSPTSTGASDSMPSTAWPSASFENRSASEGCSRGQLGGPGPDLVGEQQLAARRRPQVVDGVERALVGHGEAADLLDVVAPELDSQRMLLGGREDVDDAAAHRELTAPLDQVDAHVGGRGQVAHQPLEAVVSSPALR